MNILTVSPKDNLQNILDKLSEPTTIYLKNGIYNQKLEIKSDGVKLVGESRENTVITFADYAKKIHADGKEYNTFRTYTLCVTGEGCSIENLTVENSNTHPEEVGQCVALSVNCKSFYAERVNLVSTQDTLFLAPFPDDLVIRYRDFIPNRQLYIEGKAVHLFNNCKISGTVDFIFGCSEAYFEDCEIVSLFERRGEGYIAAPAHPLAEDNAFTFINCRLKAEGAEDNSVYLARPWRDFGKCVFLNCRADRHINTELFDKWNDTQRDKSARFYFGGLDCNFTPSPVPWAHALDGTETSEIINTVNARLKAIKAKF